MKHVRHIPLDGAYNVRDLGGYPTSDGRVTRWGMLFRSDSPARLSARDWSRLEELRVRTLIDLRSDYEAEMGPIEVPDDVHYLHLSLMRQVDELPREAWLPGVLDALPEDEMARMVRSMTVDYGEALRTNADVCARVMHELLDGLARGSVAFFCSAGKDRTGIIAALCLYLSGVERESIVADYMVTAVYNRRGIDALLRSEYADLKIDSKVLDIALSSDASTMEKFVEDLDGMDVSTLLDDAGFSKSDQGRLGTLLCEGIG